MHDFVFDAKPGRVVFAAGAIARVGDELAMLGASRALITTSRSNRRLAEAVAEALGPACADIYEDALPHVPIAQAEAARERAEDLGVDAAIAIGGGSPIGLAKAIAHRLEIPLIAVPTTYSGSEMTAIVGITRDGVKRTVAGPWIRPKTVIYDPDLTWDLPAAATATTGMNALAHCIEALYVPAANPVSSLFAEAGLRELAAGLPRAVRDGRDAEARARALYGAYLAGAALGGTGIALHHKACHVLGGTFGIGHGVANAVMLPQVVAFNAPAAAAAMAAAARALGAAGAGDEDEVRAAARAAPFLFDFVAALGAPTGLESLGLAHDALDEATRLTLELTNDNPRAVDYQGVRALFEDAWHGRRPQS